MTSQQPALSDDPPVGLPGDSATGDPEPVPMEDGLDGPSAIDSPGSDSDGDSDSGQSGVSNISGLNWKPNAGPICWVQEQIGSGLDPREVLHALRPSLGPIPSHIDDIKLWKLVVELLMEPTRREKLRHVNTLSDVVRLIRGAGNVIVLTGAGVSVSCGIPDFRSRDGIYARLAVDFPDLPDPQAMFDIHYFRRDPRPFFKFAREIYPGQFKPSPCHRFIRMLEREGKLLRNYTQNIDTLEQQAGIENVIQCHGSFATASCQRCRHRVPAEAIREAIFQQTIPLCPGCSAGDGAGTSTEACGPTRAPSPPLGEGAGPAPTDHSGQEDRAERRTAAVASSEEEEQREDGPGAVDEDTGDSGFVPSTRETEDEPDRRPPAATDDRPPAIMKPDIVFFGEGLSDEFHRSMELDRENCDLLIIIGSSLKVRPVALIPSSVSPNVAQILINREPLPHLNCDVQLLGDCDVIIDHLCHLLGEPFSELLRRPSEPQRLRELTELPPRPAPCSPAPPPPADPAHENDTDALRHCWQPKVKESIAARLPEGTYLYQAPCRYIFPGAEVLVDPDDSDSERESLDSDQASDDEGPSGGREEPPATPPLTAGCPATPPSPAPSGAAAAARPLKRPLDGPPASPCPGAAPKRRASGGPL